MNSKEQTMPKQHVFISYCRENQQTVQRLRDDLINAGEQVWWDQEILGGQDWDYAIRKAMNDSYAVIVCFSQEMEVRIRSGVYPELRDAIKLQRQYGPGSVFIIPVRLSNCQIPAMKIDDTQTLNSLQRIDLFPSSARKKGIQSLVQALRFAPAHP